MSEHICVSLVPLFNQLTLEEQKKINQLASHSQFKKGEVVFQPGDEKLIIVARGSVKVYQLSSSGKEQLLRIANSGDHEGENQLFGVDNENLFGEALKDSTICTLTKRDFNKILLEYPTLSLKLLELNAQKVYQLEQQTRFLAMERVEERLATYLLDLEQATESLEITLSMKMKDLALYLGTTPETLSRKFRLLEEEGYIERKGRQIKINDKEALEAIG